jgi:hypothetical protein
MWNNGIGSRIRDSGRRLLYWGLLFCVGAAGIAWQARHNFSEALAPSRPIDPKELSSPEFIEGLDRHPVAVDSAGAVDTGATAGYANRRDKVAAHYFALRAGDRWLLAKVPSASDGAAFTGIFAAVNARERDRVIAPFARDNQIDEQLFLPIELDGTVDTSRGLVAGLFLTALFLAPGLALVFLGLRRLRRPETHPLAQALRRFGPPAEVANAIDLSDRHLRLGPIEFAGDWLICDAPRTGYTVFRGGDLVWVHRLIETVNGKPLHRVKLYDRLGMRFEGRGREDTLEAAVATVTARWPWLVVGWDERVAQEWRDDPASLVPRVEERREELKARAARQADA